MRQSTNSELFDINDLSGCWPYYSLFVCRGCKVRLSKDSRPHRMPNCPHCKKEMSICQVTNEMFDAWLKRKADLARMMNRSGKQPEPDINEIVRRAEHEISYSAKRAIEMYWEVWQKRPAFYLFLKCAQVFVLCQGEIEQCKYLMREYGMVEDEAL